MLELKLENIKTDVNYKDLNFFESVLTHDLHRLTDNDFVSNEEEKALLSAVLNYVGYAVDYEPKQYILDYVDYFDFVDEDEEFTEETLEKAYDEAIYAFRRCGLLYKEFGGFADGTYYRQTVSDERKYSDVFK